MTKTIELWFRVSQKGRLKGYIVYSQLHFIKKRNLKLTSIRNLCWGRISDLGLFGTIYFQTAPLSWIIFLT